MATEPPVTPTAARPTCRQQFIRLFMSLVSLVVTVADVFVQLLLAIVILVATTYLVRVPIVNDIVVTIAVPITFALVAITLAVCIQIWPAVRSFVGVMLLTTGVLGLVDKRGSELGPLSLIKDVSQRDMALFLVFLIGMLLISRKVFEKMQALGWGK